jgi:replication factor C large subunit
MQPWIHKFVPKTADDIKGQDKALAELANFLKNYKTQKKRAALIYGPPGSGKTTSVYALANDLNLEVLEVNASDYRNRDKIDSSVGSASQQMSLFARGKIILVDEIDGLSGRDDRGGIKAILQHVKASPYPIILTAANPWHNKFSSLRRKSNLIQFHALEYPTVNNVLKDICREQKIEYDESALKCLSRMVGGDMRAAINDLQSLTSDGKLTKKDLEQLTERNQTDTMINALTVIFKTTDPKIAIKAFNSVEEDQDHQFLWIDENLRNE